MRTVWVLGDQLNRQLGAMARAAPEHTRVLLVESAATIEGRRWHVQRLHLVLTAMRRFAAELAEEGFEVDHRRAATLEAGYREHLRACSPDEVLVTEPSSHDARALMVRLGVTAVRNDHFLCHRDDFAEWAASRRSVRMEDFYRWQRRRLGYLMDDDEPVGGRWNFDAENRQPPPGADHVWPAPVRDELDAVDREVLADLPPQAWGAPPSGLWPTSRERALVRLDHVVEHVLVEFGPYEDAMTRHSWHLSHTLLSPALNLGLLHPSEVCDRVEVAHRSGEVPLASAEGLIRQVIGWREYVWGRYWQWMPDYREANELDARRALPPVFSGSPTRMRCVATVLGDVEEHGWTHHIQRLMVLGNLCLLSGVDPAELVEWMWTGFVDGAEWVMLPNVIGMALHADGGRMATKPYAAGGAYIDRMSDYCGDCEFDRRARTGPDACPFTTLYWDFLDRHRERFARNPRTAQQVRGLDRLGDLDAVRRRAAEVLVSLDGGAL